ncbi:hypothetical protein P43SY_009165 [Pythium insidiosum]|uniref:Uncharacterized protein n=1 Tax=Pythium insidiosum TaxID=114742 RepID=A0AAD5LSD1_PYTIN|nr:hypothetical protein P43SY_009165 [Pythium insidiosum]
MEPAPPFDGARDDAFAWGSAPSDAATVADAGAATSNPFDVFGDETASVPLPPPLSLVLPGSDAPAASSISVGSPLISFSPVAAAPESQLALEPPPTTAIVADLLSFSPVAAPAAVPADPFLLPLVPTVETADDAVVQGASAIGELLSFSPVAAAPPSATYVDVAAFGMQSPVDSDASPSTSAALVSNDDNLLSFEAGESDNALQVDESAGSTPNSAVSVKTSSEMEVPLSRTLDGEQVIEANGSQSAPTQPSDGLLLVSIR